MIVRRLRLLLRTAILLYTLYAVIMIVAHPVFLYPFQPKLYQADGFAPQVIETDDGTITTYLHKGEPGAPLILYFMGNAGSLAYFQPMLAHHAAQGRWVLAMGYRGGGGLSGKPSEARLKADAMAMYQAAPGLTNGRHGATVVQGYSLGTGLAMHVAASETPDGVILSAPYARLCDLMTRQSALPACWLAYVQKWDSQALAPNVTSPVLVLHGAQDVLIPIEQGRALAEALAPHAAFRAFADAGHTDMISAPGYLTAIDDFIETRKNERRP